MDVGMNIGIIGVGGVGGYFGAKLCRLISSQGINVYFLARGRHLKHIRQHGLLVKTAAEGEWICRPALADDKILDFPMLDACLVCVKSFDLSNVIQQLKPRVTNETFILPLLNGVDIYERIRADLSAAHVFPACTYIGVHIESPGKIVQRGGDCKILFGKDPRAAHVIPHRLFEIFEQSAIKYEWQEDISPILWTKFIFIAGLSLVQAAFDKTLGQVRESPQLSEYVRVIMGEIAALAEKKRIILPENIVEENYEKSKGFAYETKTSFQRDFENLKKPDERDLFCGAPVRMGKQLGVATPMIREIWDILEKRKPWTGS
jgi:2-dehydropantoate 2-reductase